MTGVQTCALPIFIAVAGIGVLVAGNRQQWIVGEDFQGIHYVVVVFGDEVVRPVRQIVTHAGPV